MSKDRDPESFSVSDIGVDSILEAAGLGDSVEAPPPGPPPVGAADSAWSDLGLSNLSALNQDDSSGGVSRGGFSLGFDDDEHSLLPDADQAGLSGVDSRFFGAPMEPNESGRSGDVPAAARGPRVDSSVPYDFADARPTEAPLGASASVAYAPTQGVVPVQHASEQFDLTLASGFGSPPPEPEGPPRPRKSGAVARALAMHRERTQSSDTPLSPGATSLGAPASAPPEGARAELAHAETAFPAARPAPKVAPYRDPNASSGAGIHRRPRSGSNSGNVAAVASSSGSYRSVSSSRSRADGSVSSLPSPRRDTSGSSRSVSGTYPIVPSTPAAPPPKPEPMAREAFSGAGIMRRPRRVSSEAETSADSDSGFTGSPSTQRPVLLRPQSRTSDAGSDDGQVLGRARVAMRRVSREDHERELAEREARRLEVSGPLEVSAADDTAPDVSAEHERAATALVPDPDLTPPAPSGPADAERVREAVRESLSGSVEAVDRANAPTETLENDEQRRPLDPADVAWAGADLAETGRRRTERPVATEATRPRVERSSVSAAWSVRGEAAVGRPLRPVSPVAGETTSFGAPAADTVGAPLRPAGPSRVAQPPVTADAIVGPNTLDAVARPLPGTERRNDTEREAAPQVRVGVGESMTAQLPTVGSPRDVAARTRVQDDDADDSSIPTRAPGSIPSPRPPTGAKALAEWASRRGRS